MASGDTKTQQYLGIAANGTRADLQRGCCNTRTQDLIMDVAERIITEEETRAREDQILQNEINEIKNSPDVADIVPTYAALQDYDTSTLTDKDIIRVLADETHGGASTYYRWSTSSQTFTYVGETGDYYTKSQVNGLLDDKQDLLTAGDGITIEEESGALVISSTGGGGGTSNFNQLTNRPSYDNTTMTGSTSIPKVPTATSELTNDSGFITSSALPTVNDATLTITQNGASVGTFTANDADDATIALTDTTYSAGTGLDLTGTTFSADTTVLATKTDLDSKQDELTAGDNVTIEDESGALVISATDTTYSNFTGTDGSSVGAAGLVPAPSTTDAGKFLKADGTWDTAGGGSGPTVVQTTGTSTTDVMSQNAVTSMVFADPATQYKIKIGAGTSTSEGSNAVEIGHNAKADGSTAVALGYSSRAQSTYSIALGASSGDNYTGYEGCISIGRDSKAKAKGAVALGIGSGYTGMAVGEMHIGTDNTTYGYNSSNYRLLSGLYDGQSAHDAVTVEQVNATIDAINTALSTNIPHIGA